MDFPDFVPEGARNNALHFLRHYKPILAAYEAELDGIEESITYWLYQDDDSVEHRLIKLRCRKIEATRRRDVMARNIANIKRLVHDARMRDAYQILTNAFFDSEDSERQWKIDCFIWAAWAARLDYSPYRERLKQAAELRDEIATTVDKLADLLDRIGKTGVSYPAEFSHVPSLLRNTDNYECDGYNLHMWRAVRGYVLGDPPQSERVESEQAEQNRNTLSYLW